MNEVLREALARIPSVESLLQADGAGALVSQHGRSSVVEAIRATLAGRRSDLRAGRGAPIEPGSIIEAVRRELETRAAPQLRPVLNLTGTVLHTNLGRAPLPEAAIERIAAVARGPSNLEFDLQAGARGDRDEHVESWLVRLTGAQAATIVNNNAAAVLLLLNTLALRRDVVISRGELVEIGGSFRVPSIMARAGAKLREVGTTNRTHAGDYVEAIGRRTALVMRVHASNYAIEGFTARVSDRELAALARERNIPFVVDLGSGSLVDLTAFGLPHEPTVREAIEAGADLVTFSGDKLLGGPQAGLIVGRRDLIERIRRNPLKRALRCDKLTIAALGAVLPLHADPDRLAERLPTLRLLTRPLDDIVALAHRIRPVLQAALAGRVDVELVSCLSQIGSGARPVDLLPSAALRLTPRRAAGRSAGRLAAALRRLPVPVLGRIEAGAVILDLRCLLDPDVLLQQIDLLPGLVAAEGS